MGLEVVVLRKAGEPLLVVPRGVPALAKALDLYPAQTSRAKLVKFLWRQMLRWKITGAAQADSVQLDPADPFLRFLDQVSRRQSNLQTLPSDRHGIPKFALLAGNPYASGRRFLLLVFSPEGKPVTVVKAGNESAAKQLVEKEAAFLGGIPAGLPAIPRLRERFDQDRVQAFALDFVEGFSPGPRQAMDIEPLLTSWLRAGRTLAVRDLPAWQRLGQACADRNLFSRLAAHLESELIQPAVFHGDFAPWNVKISTNDGAWTVLDWERGEQPGPPAWDWFHYTLQPAILVQRRSVGVLANTAQELLDSAAFGAYAQAAGLTARRREWLLAYLLYCRDVLRPAEGSPRVVELLNLLANQWASH